MWTGPSTAPSGQVSSVSSLQVQGQRISLQRDRAGRRGLDRQGLSFCLSGPLGRKKFLPHTLRLLSTDLEPSDEY